MIPNGYFHDGHVLWEDGRDWVISKGFEVSFPDLSTSNDYQWLRLQYAIRTVLKAVGPNERLQVALHTNSGFPELDRYDKVTNESDAPLISKKIRNELSDYFRARMASGNLIRSNVRMHISSHVKVKRKRACPEILSGFQKKFEHRGAHLDLTLRSLGGSTSPMDNTAHYREMLRYWSPGQTPVEEIDWSQDIESLCRRSDFAARPDHGFYLDGRYFGIFAIRLMPVSSFQKTMNPFADLAIPNLRITLNMFPLKVADEIAHERERHKRLRLNVGDVAAMKGLGPHEERIDNLQKLQVLPFRCQMIVTVSGKTSEELDDNMEAVRYAIDHTGCTGFMVNLPTSAVQYLNRATPGFGPWMSYKGFEHKLDDQHLANIWPIHSTPVAELSTADWISCGERGNIIGGEVFTGAQPKNLIIIGNTGAGKSVLGQTTVMQAVCRTRPVIKFIGLLDDGSEKGSSWAETCRQLDPTCKSIVVRSNGEHTFNPFDTRELALSSQHLRSAVALPHVLVGVSDDKDRDWDRVAILSKVIKELYVRDYDNWKRKEPAGHFKACKKAVLARRSEEDFVDAIQALKQDPEKTAEDEFMVSEDEAVAIDRDKATQHFVREAAFSMWTPEMFFTLSDLQDEINARKSESLLHLPLANQLERWLRDGEYGPIVDGPSNIDLGTSYMDESSPLKVVHFELGKGGNSEAALKSVVGFLIANEFRNVVQNLPRRIGKILIIEEMTNFLRIPNAQEIVIDYSERMRKYLCWLIYIFQQYSSLLKANEAVAEAIIGNSLSMFLMQTVNSKELETLAKHMPMPEPIIQAIGNMPSPESIKGPQAYAGFVYVNKAGKQPTFTVGRNMISKDVDKIVSSSGFKDEKPILTDSPASSRVRVPA